jgi:23S rRNA (uracil747-C5)-methyltransferase
LIESEYEIQVKHKEDKLFRALGIKLLPGIASSVQEFRNKAKIIITGSMNAPVLGLAGEENLDEGREILECPLHHEEINKLLPELKSFITTAHLMPYQISEKKGELKGAIIFTSGTTRETYLRLSLRSKESLDRIKKFLPSFLEKHPGLKCVSATIQPVHQAMLEGNEEIFFTDEHFVHHKIGPFTFKVDTRAFVQTNEKVAARLYETAANWVGEIKPARFTEVYSGQGAFSLHCSAHFKDGLSFEINPEAVKVANETAQIHGVQKLRFVSADAASIEKEVSAFAPEMILVNPPRRGLGESARWLLESGPSTILYSSCSHESLKKDLEVLKGNYELKRAQLFDMFPHTEHFETLVLLQRHSR